MNKLLIGLISVCLLGCNIKSDSVANKCERIISVVSMTVCDDYANTSASYIKNNWQSKQDCYDDIKEDFMEVCKEQIKSSDYIFVIHTLGVVTGIEPKLSN